MSSLQEQITAATWSTLCEPGDGMAGLLRANLGSTKALELVSRSFSASQLIKELPKDDFRAEKFESTLTDCLEIWRRRLKSSKPEQALEQIHKLGGRFVIQGDDYWPYELEDLGYSTPTGLWILGDPIHLKHELKLSVIGSRLASDYGLKLTRDLVRFAVSNDWLVVSGGALGIDAMASSTALAEGHKTIAVLAGGLDKWYPPANQDMFQKIIQNGCLVSEMPPGFPPARWRFLQRNRLIAALSQATLVVEAGFRSGSINTAGHANELGRRVGAVPGPVDSVRSAGCHRLIREGRAELIATPGQLSELMGVGNDDELSFNELSHDQTRTLDALRREVLQVEEVALRSGLTRFQTEQVLKQLVSKSLVIETSQGFTKQ